MGIMNFSQFVNESQDVFAALPKSVRDFFIDITSKNILSKVVGSKNFNILLEGRNIYLEINGNKILFPFSNYIDGKVLLNKQVLKDPTNAENFNISLGLPANFHIHRWISAAESIKLRDNEPNEIGNIIDYKGEPIRVYNMSAWASNPDEDQKRFLSPVYDVFLKIRDSLGKDDKLLNPFVDIDLKNNPFIKLLDKIGVYIDTRENRKKKGILRFSVSNAGYGLIIQPNGYIRKDLGDKTPVLTSNIQISGPVYTEEDLNAKLSYLLMYAMKDRLLSYNVPVKITNQISKAYAEGNFENYNRLLSDVIREHPLLAPILPDPNDIVNPDVKQGASILGKFGLF